MIGDLIVMIGFVILVLALIILMLILIPKPILTKLDYCSNCIINDISTYRENNVLYITSPKQIHVLIYVRCLDNTIFIRNAIINYIYVLNLSEFCDSKIKYVSIISPIFVNITKFTSEKVNDTYYYSDCPVVKVINDTVDTTSIDNIVIFGELKPNVIVNCSNIFVVR